MKPPLRNRISFIILVASLFPFALGLIIYLGEKVVRRLTQVSPDQIYLGFIPQVKDLIRPEPVERTTFLLCMLLLPAILTLIHPLVNGLRRNKTWTHLDKLDHILLVCSACILYLPLAFSPTTHALIAQENLSLIENISLSLAAIVGASLLLYLKINIPILRPLGLAKNKRLISLAVFYFLLLLVPLTLNSYRLFSFNHLSTSRVWWIHYDLIASDVAQVEAGRTMLVDIPALYGLYPHIISPIFSAFSQNTQTLTTVFGALQIASVTAVLLVMKKLIKTPFLFLLGGLALLLATFGTCQTIGYQLWNEPDPYFQYFPVRFVWPAFSLPLIFLFGRAFSARKIALLSVANALGLFWNLDSGVAVLYAETMLFLVLAILSLRRKHVFRAWNLRSLLVTAILIPAFSLLLYSLSLLMLSVRAGRPINLDWLFAYQAIFFAKGFGMLPVPLTPDAWQIIAGFYIIAFIVSINRLLNRDDSNRSLIPLYLSLLGVGLFTYYQGRSHYLNLISVSWPFIVLVSLMIDSHLRAVSYKRASMPSIVLPVVGLAGLLFPSTAIIIGLPSILKSAYRLPFEERHAHYKKSDLLADELAFVSKHCSGSPPSCLMLNKRQGIYALEANTASVFAGPSPMGLVVQKDHDQLLANVRNGDFARIILGVAPDSKLDWVKVKWSDFSRYRKVDMNSMGTLFLLERR
jgi:hypothetical protein